MGAELSFCELRSRQVINVIDGRVLGRICDVIFSRQSARVLGFVVPGTGGFSIFKPRGDIFIPFERICKIGHDVVLVELKPMHPHHHHEILEHKPEHGHGHKN
ncbi:MAG: YlmC/YmxH family sporulation protein [Firmicutes bacterium]|nr:YlmC/YmxH family sporulation protein [Bacillota bacterium]